MSHLSDALFTMTQQRVLCLLYTRPDRSFYTNEILRSTGMGVATIKRELDRMVAAGIVTLRRQGNQHHYQVNPDCPIYQELLSIVRKTFGVVDVLRQALDPLAEKKGSVTLEKKSHSQVSPTPFCLPMPPLPYDYFKACYGVCPSASH